MLLCSPDKWACLLHPNCLLAQLTLWGSSDVGISTEVSMPSSSLRKTYGVISAASCLISLVNICAFHIRKPREICRSDRRHWSSYFFIISAKGVCQSSGKITQTVMKAFQLHFREMLPVGQGTTHYILVMFLILEGLWPLIFQRSKPVMQPDSTASYLPSVIISSPETTTWQLVLSCFIVLFHLRGDSLLANISPYFLHTVAFFTHMFPCCGVAANWSSHCLISVATCPQSPLWRLCNRNPLI